MLLVITINVFHYNTSTINTLTKKQKNKTTHKKVNEMQNITSQIKSLQSRLDFINLEQKRKDDLEKQRQYTHIVSGCLDFDSKDFDDIDDYRYKTK